MEKVLKQPPPTPTIAMNELYEAKLTMTKFVDLVAKNPPQWTNAALQYRNIIKQFNKLVTNLSLPGKQWTRDQAISELITSIVQKILQLHSNQSDVKFVFEFMFREIHRDELFDIIWDTQQHEYTKRRQVGSCRTTEDHISTILQSLHARLTCLEDTVIHTRHSHPIQHSFY